MRRLLACLLLIAAATPAFADQASDRKQFAEYIKTCSKPDAGDSRTAQDCLADQVLSANSYLGDILAETEGFLQPKDVAPLRRAQKAWEAYRAATCAYHKGRAAEPEMDELYCFFHVTEQRVEEIRANDDFAKYKLTKKK